MAKFNMPLPLVSGADINASKGVLSLKPTADTSGEVRGKGQGVALELRGKSDAIGIRSATDLFFGGVKVADTLIKENIVSEQRDIVDAFQEQDLTDQSTGAFDNLSSGQDAESEVARFTESAKVPVAITSKIQEFDRKLTGQAQGRGNEIFFLDKLDKDLKSLKARFPFYRDYIDGEAARLTGTPSANSIRNQRKAIISQMDTASAKQQKFELKLRQDVLAEGLIPPELADGMSVKQMNDHIGLSKGRRQGRADDDAKLASKTLSEKQEATTVRAGIVRESLSNADLTARLAGLDGIRGIYEKVGEFFTNIRSMTTGDRDQLNTLVTTLRNNMVRMDQDTVTEVMDESGLSYLEVLQRSDPDMTAVKAAERLNSNWKQYFDELLDPDSDTNIMKAFERTIVRDEQDLINIGRQMADVRDLRVMAGSLGKGLAGLLPTDRRTVVTVKRVSDSFLASSHPTLTPEAAVGHTALTVMKETIRGRFSQSPGSAPSMTQTAAGEFVVKSGGSPSQQAATNLLIQTSHINTVLDPAADKQSRINAAKFLYNPDDRNFLLGLPAAEHARVYAMRYNQSMTKAIQSLGEPNRLKAYTTQARRDLAQLQTTARNRLLQNVNPLIRVYVDPKTNLLAYEREPNEINELTGTTEGTMQDADLIASIVDGFNQMGLQYETTMGALNRSDVTDFEGEGTNPHIQRFFKSVVGIPAFSSLHDSPHVQIIKQAVTTPAPLVDADDVAIAGSVGTSFMDRVLGRGGAQPGGPQFGISKLSEALQGTGTGATPSLASGDALLNTGRPEDDGGQTATAPQVGPDGNFIQAVNRGVGEDDGGQTAPVATPTVTPPDTTRQSSATPAGSPPDRTTENPGPTSGVDLSRVAADQASRIAKKVFPDAVIDPLNRDTGDDDSIENSRIFRRLLEGASPSDFPKAGNMGVLSAIRKVLGLDSTVGDERLILERVEDILDEQERDSEPQTNSFTQGISPAEEAEEVDFEALKGQAVIHKAALRPESDRNKTVRLYSSAQVASFKPFLDSIGTGESAGNYNAMNQGTRGRGKKQRMIGVSTTDTLTQIATLGKPLVKFTIGQIKAMQKGTFAKGRKLFAAGKYQIIPKTMLIALKNSGLTDSDLFNEANQDLLAINLAMNKQPALGAYLRGTSNNLKAAMRALADEWASFPDPKTGKSRYGGVNKASAKHSRKKVAAMLMQMRLSFAA